MNDRGFAGTPLQVEWLQTLPIILESPHLFHYLEGQGMKINVLLQN